MSINFKQIPQNLLVPLFYAEVDASLANTAIAPQRTLLIGQILAAGVAAANVPILSQGPADAKTQCGIGSMLQKMYNKYRDNDPVGEVWFLPLADAGGGSQASGNVAFTAQATTAGTLSLYVGGELVSMAVATTQTVAQLATALAAAINAIPDFRVTAAVNGGNNFQVDLTYRHKGLVGNDVDIRFNYYGAAAGEALPPGLAATITPMAGGATNPTLTTALSNLIDQPFDFIVCPYTDATSLTAMTALMNDSSGRWSWSRQVFGHVWTAYRGTVGALTTEGTGLNDQHLTMLGFNDSPSLAAEIAAAVTGAAATSIKADPALPLQTLAVYGVKAPPLKSRFQLTDRQTLLQDGISTFTVDQSGLMRLENIITTYQKNAFSQVDNSYLEVETMYTLAYALRDLASMVTSKYARVKLAANGTRLDPGTNIVTPNMIRVDIIARYKQLEAAGIVQNSTFFAANLVVQQNGTNPNRVDVLWPAVLVDQLRIFAVLAQFRLI